MRDWQAPLRLRLRPDDWRGYIMRRIGESLAARNACCPVAGHLQELIIRDGVASGLTLGYSLLRHAVRA